MTLLSISRVLKSTILALSEEVSLVVWRFQLLRKCCSSYAFISNEIFFELKQTRWICTFIRFFQSNFPQSDEICPIKAFLLIGGYIILFTSFSRLEGALRGLWDWDRFFNLLINFIIIFERILQGRITLLNNFRLVRGV